MAGEKTTKEILNEKLASKKRTPLYNAEVLGKMKEDFEPILPSEGQHVTIEYKIIEGSVGIEKKKSNLALNVRSMLNFFYKK